MNRWRLYSISLVLVMGLVALAPIHMHAWDGADSEFLYIVKHLYDSDRDGGAEEQANSNGLTDDFDGAEAEFLDITKKKPLEKEDARQPAPRTTGSTIYHSINKGTSQPC
ncbi:MAG: hypothetical protein ACE5OZ_16490 [Candidatus Heimdallarchaeota archaeon]